MSWISENHSFDEIDPRAETYFRDADYDAKTGYAYTFAKLPELRALIKRQKGDLFTDEQTLEIAKNAFRNKPKSAPQATNVPDREVADFIYAL